MNNLLANPCFIGGVVACFLDKTIPGNASYRLLDQMIYSTDQSKVKRFRIELLTAGCSLSTRLSNQHEKSFDSVVLVTNYRHEKREVY